MKYISFKETLRIHTVAIKRYGGSIGVRDQGLIESALARPRASYGDYEAYPDVFTKAAVLLEGLVKNHGFVDGNKRTAIAVTSVFLQKNGFYFLSNKDELVRFVLDVSTDKLDIEESAEWLKNKSRDN